MLQGNRCARVVLLNCLVTLSACSYEQAEWTFDQGDMEQAVYGTWHGDYTVAGGAPAPLTLEIKAPDASLAPQCGTRTFSQGAPAPGLSPTCTVESSLTLAATLSVEAASFSDTELAGYFLVSGNQLSSGALALDATDAEFHLSATWSHGAFESCGIWERTKVADCTLSERE